jgi:hypothetical protein
MTASNLDQKVRITEITCNVIINYVINLKSKLNFIKFHLIYVEIILKAGFSKIVHLAATHLAAILWIARMKLQKETWNILTSPPVVHVRVAI